MQLSCIPLVDDDLLRSVGLRMTRFDNYNIFYYYDMQNHAVFIIRVLYNKVYLKDKWSESSLQVSQRFGGFLLPIFRGK